MKLAYQNQQLGLHTHSKCAGQESELQAIQLIYNSGFSLLDAARLCLALLEASDGEHELSRLHSLIRTAAQVQAENKRSASSAEALQACLQQKAHRSPRTLQDIRQTMGALMRFDPELAQRPIRELSSSDCHRLLHGAFAHSPSRFIKAKANLSGVFTIAYQCGWCKDNPVQRIATPTVKERCIEPLSMKDVESLLTQAKRREHRDCLPAVGLMLYAGVRPDELKRLRWNDIDWEDGILYMSAKHTKTGGGRHVPLTKSLLHMLKQERQVGSICPSNWTKKWRNLRECAGFNQWIPDILRHSYASYHAKMYRDLPLLQLSMGHRDCQLLRTRYINMRGISRRDAQQFWRTKLTENSRN